MLKESVVARSNHPESITFECRPYIGIHNLNAAMTTSNDLRKADLDARLVAVALDVKRHNDPEATNITASTLGALGDFIQGGAKGSVELFRAPNWAWDLPAIRALRFGISLGVLKVTTDLQTVRQDDDPAAAYGTILRKAQVSGHNLYLLEQQSANDPMGMRTMSVLDGSTGATRVVIEAANTFSWPERHLADLALRDYVSPVELNTFLGTNKANRWTTPDGPSLLAALEDFGQGGTLSPEGPTGITYFDRKGTLPV